MKREQNKHNQKNNWTTGESNNTSNNSPQQNMTYAWALLLIQIPIFIRSSQNRSKQKQDNYILNMAAAVSSIA
ncbi:hypothetical protein [Ectobacillus panaciterrae]|uniref:hypothetical protein n=1 Tax=Ectobacillus panaciterrae TaxID=363872 RepID=UPI0009D74997|nr:hypothetical protein [Ectobacillus panaciterrae]